MELNSLIDELLKSKILENQELGVAILSSPEISEEEKIKYIKDFFVKDFHQFISPDKDRIFRAWLELYNNYVNTYVKERVKKI